MNIYIYITRKYTEDEYKKNRKIKKLERMKKLKKSETENVQKVDEKKNR